MPGTAPLTPQILERLGQLILLLSSPHDGEKVAACGAITRTLGAAGLDLHALAEIVRRAAAADAPPDPPRDATSPQGRAAWCLRVGAAILKSRERKFLHDIARARFALTDKQRVWLEAIVERVQAAAR
ncbi:MAG: hypothetical protein KF889_17140 [Alphaproteobacteria bacterium]|nr:hypothetical protein [Alphaproteobacteria bacterium]MCW5739905.1 hypothetical protein [Alphaproteobacteria bacterium]